MMQLSPGSLIQYRASGSSLLPWPAVICTDDMASDKVVRIRPHGRWARTTEMSDFDPFAPFTNEDTVGSTPGLGDAYEMANNALDAGLDLDYWREQVTNPAIDASGSESYASDSDEDACSKRDMRRALLLSREEFHGKRPKEKSATDSATLLTPSLSPPTPARIPGSHRIAVAAEASGTSTLSRQTWKVFPNDVASSSKPSGQRGELRALSSPRDLLYHDTPNTPIDLTNDSSSSRSAGKRPVQPTPVQHLSFFDNALGGLSRSRKEPISDTVEGEISESKDFVQVLVGPDAEVSTLQKESVWNRPYFRDPRYGVNHFDHNDNGIWELQHPALAQIEPEDFVFAAEYFESDGFGHRYPQEGDETEEAFAQCVSAWITAERLGMSDLMDHIVEKLERLVEPEMQAVLVFACHVYGPQDTVLPSQARLKEYLAMYISENWWIYLSDDHLRSDFIEQLQRLPELERDVYRRRMPPLDERVKRDQGDDDTDMS